MMTLRKKVISFSELGELKHRHDGLKIVQCHGVFDVLHMGHIAYFQSSRANGDILVITITADRFVNKGPGRPYFNENVRAQMLAALEMVDYVCISDFSTAVNTICRLRPDYYAKGPDYKNRDSDITGAIYDEERAVVENGGQIVFTEDDTFSSSTLINKFFASRSSEQNEIIEKIRELGGVQLLDQQLAKCAEQTVTVIGEPIVDTYVFCAPESISTKSPSISAKYLFEENYNGGSMAIANHLADFAKKVRLVISHGDEPYFRKLLDEGLDPRIELIETKLKNIPTPRKTRFVTQDGKQRIFEVTNLRSDQWQEYPSETFCSLLDLATKDADQAIIADFGHGLFEGPVLDAVGRIKPFISLNVQTNSSNLGFNPFTKHSRFSYLSIDTKEARLATHDRYSSPKDLAQQIAKKLAANSAHFALTLGSDGALYFSDKSDQNFYAPAFVDSVIDATGAGDAFLALTSLLVKNAAPNESIPFLGNVFAGLKTRIIGNKSSVSKTQFYKAINALLK